MYWKLIVGIVLTSLSRNGKFIKYNVSVAFVRITFKYYSILHFLNELVKILIC